MINHFVHQELIYFFHVFGELSSNDTEATLGWTTGRRTCWRRASWRRSAGAACRWATSSACQTTTSSRPTSSSSPPRSRTGCATSRPPSSMGSSLLSSFFFFFFNFSLSVTLFIHGNHGKCLSGDNSISLQGMPLEEFFWSFCEGRNARDFWFMALS